MTQASSIHSRASILVLLSACAAILMAPSVAESNPDPEYLTLARQAIAAPRHPAGSAPLPLKDGVPWTLQQCRDHALQRSLAMHMVSLEAYTKDSIARGRKVQIYPHLFTSNELSKRDNFAFAFGEILGRDGEGPAGGGSGVNQFSRSRDRGTLRYTLESRWSPTDALLAHYVTKSARNDLVKEKLMRIRVAQQLMGTVESAFHRLVGLQHMLALTAQLVELRQTLHDDSKALESDQLIDIEELHRVNKKLLQAQALARMVAHERDQQSEYLGSVMRADPNQRMGGRLRVTGDIAVPAAAGDIAAIEQEAIERRPEAYQAGLDHLSAKNDIKRADLKMYPKLTGFYRYTRDIDKHLLENDWREHGLYLSYDVLDVIGARHERRAAKFRADKTRLEIASVALGIATQVREAFLKYNVALEEAKASDAILASQMHVLDTVRRRTANDGQDGIALTETEGDYVQEHITNVRTITEANARMAELRGAVGSNFVEPFPRR